MFVSYFHRYLLPFKISTIASENFFLTDLWKKELQQSNEVLLLHDCMGVREELFSAKAREGAVSALKAKGRVTCGSEDDTIFGITGNFRKLEVD